MKKPEWSKEKLMASVEKLEFVHNLRSLFGPVIVVERLHLADSDVLLVRSKDSNRNWVFGKSDDHEAPVPEIRRLTIDNGTVRWRDELKDLEADAEVKTEMQDAQGRPQQGCEHSGGAQSHPYYRQLWQSGLQRRQRRPDQAYRRLGLARFDQSIGGAHTPDRNRNSA